ncbi:MAG: DUF4350 domain-containing protein [Kofleriaceae bacterium]
MRRLLAAVLALGLGLFALAPTARAQPADDAVPERLGDYDPNSTDWNGLATLARLAEGVAQLQVVPVATLEWSELDAADILLLLYPLRRLDPSRLDAFIQAGGHVIVADDFGEASDALARLQLIRGQPSAPRASRYHDGRSYAPIATARGDHPLTRDVGDVVTNHPAVITRLEGATSVVGIDDGTIVAAGERGTGRFVVVSDPSIFINRMLQFPGNLQLTINMLRWLDRGGRARRVVLVRGDVPMYGDPRPYIDDAGAGVVGRGVADLNRWLGDRSDWLLTPIAMRVIAGVLAILLVALVLTALPARRRGAAPDGAWLRLGRRPRRDAPATLVEDADAAHGRRANLVVAACVLRDVTTRAIADATGVPDPLHARGERELVRALGDARGPEAAAQLARVYRRLRALPSRGQAAAAWGGGALGRREFDALYEDAAALCRTLGVAL